MNTNKMDDPQETNIADLKEHDPSMFVASHY